MLLKDPVGIVWESVFGRCAGRTMSEWLPQVGSVSTRLSHRNQESDFNSRVASIAATLDEILLIQPYELAIHHIVLM
jgi:hypothetical protein